MKSGRYDEDDSTMMNHVDQSFNGEFTVVEEPIGNLDLTIRNSSKINDKSIDEYRQ